MNRPDDEDKAAIKREDLFLVHSRMLIALFVSTVILILFIAIPLFRAYLKGEQSPIPILLLVLLTGALGAFVSALQRSHSFEGVAPILLGKYKKVPKSWFLYIYSIIPPLIGAIAAVVVYVFFQSQILESPAFPDFVCKPVPPKLPSECSTLNDFFDFGPSGMSDYAKALLWAFIAGFSERLLPDIIGKITRQLDAN